MRIFPDIKNAAEIRGMPVNKRKKAVIPKKCPQQPTSS